MVTLISVGFASQALLMVHASGSLHISSQSGDSQQVKTFVIEVSHHGFNHTSGKLTITVNEGDRVRLVFKYADHDLQSGNPHVIYLGGYNMETAEINASNPEATLEFTAGQIGEFNFYCAIPCAGMSELQLGYFVVVPSSSSRMETHMTLSAARASPERNELSIVARMTSHDERPVAGIVVKFYVNTSFGPMLIGSATTDNSGVASITYTGPLHKTMQIIAVFTGSGSFAMSSASMVVSVEARRIEQEPVGLPYSLGQNALPDIRAVGVPLQSALTIVGILGLIVGSIWSIYGYVAYQLLGVWKGAKQRKPDTLVAAEAMTQPAIGLTKGTMLWALLVAIGLGTGLAASFAPVSISLKVPAMVLATVIETILVRVLIFREPRDGHVSS